MPRVLARLAESSGRGQALAPVWSSVVGPHIARHAVPGALEGSTLVITVSSAEWAQELARQEQALCERLAAVIGPGRVRSLAFRLEAPCSPSR